MSSHETAVADPWAWARESDPAPIDVSAATVHVLIPGGAGTAWLESLVGLCAAQTVRPVRITVGGTLAEASLVQQLAAARHVYVDMVAAATLAELWQQVGDSGADYCWVLTAEAEMAPDTLERLLRTMADPSVAATGPVVSRQLTRRSDPIIEWAGATLTDTGVPVSYEGVGEVNQGQIETPTVLGLPLSGMLVHTQTLRAVGGFGFSANPGLDVGALASLAGARVVVTGDAAITLIGPATGSATASRRSGMNLASALSGASVWHAIVTVVGTLLGALGYLLVREPREAGVAMSALSGWMADGSQRKQLRERMGTLPASFPKAVQALRPRARARLALWGEGVLGGIGEWVDGFSVRVDSGSVLDDLTGEDSAEASRWRLSPALVGFVVLLVGAGVSVAALLRPGLVSGEQLLPAPSFAALWESYLAPVAGQPAGSGPPWLALVGMVSVLTLGHVDFAVFATIIVIVPVTWLATYRWMRHVLTEQPQAMGASAIVALSPALVGATNRGDIGTSVALLFVVLAALAALRLAADGTWRWAATVAACVVIAAAIQPLIWLGAVGAGVWAAITHRISWSKLSVVILGPVIAFGPWALTLWRWPGRLLTGPEPALAAGDPGGVWMLLGRDAGTGLPPLWVSIAVIGVLWVLALAGLFRVGRAAALGWIVALGGLGVAVALSKLVVAVPPGVFVRPAVTFWLAVFVAGLAIAAALGTDRIVAELRDASLGWRQISVGVGAVAAVGLTVVAVGWWATGGARDLQRAELTTVPPFVANAQQDGDPGRTLAIRMSDGQQASWELLEADMPRLGDGERGIAAAGSATATAQAAGVVERLLAGTADDLLVSDLRDLGVGYIWVADADQGVLSNIGNTPGLGVGSGDDDMWVWPVPESAIAVVTSEDGAMPVGDGSTVSEGSGERVLVLSEPADPRWTASIGGTQLEPLPTTDWRQRFAVNGSAGELTYELTGSQWWAWIQVALAAVWVLMVMPTGRRAAPGMRGGVS